MARVANFTAGPAALPLPVLEEAQRELLDYQGTGMSIMENSHRSKTFDAVHNEALDLARELLGIPTSYDVLFLHGGASQQFALIPMNFLRPGKSADYIVSGHWSERALEEAQIVGKARIAGTSKDAGFMRVPTKLDLDPDAAYVHMTSNNTIYGTELFSEPDVGKVPLVSDMSSDFMSRRIDVTKYGMIYAGAQKNLGPSGVALGIIRKDLVESARTDIPVVFRYGTIAKANSMFNTPPTFAIYLVRGVLRWLKVQGGLDAIEKVNLAKAKHLYGAIDAAPDYYRCPVETSSRSHMNVVWRLPSDALDDKFASEATKAGLVGLKGHRSVGGMRASLYNAISEADVQKLVDFMAEFRTRNPA
ncbi:MAG: 3-phosphoserine/phosphohydroxythreonine transaminase [Polyangia bacterium]